MLRREGKIQILSFNFLGFLTTDILALDSCITL